MIGVEKGNFMSDKNVKYMAISSFRLRFSVRHLFDDDVDDDDDDYQLFCGMVDQQKTLSYFQPGKSSIVTSQISNMPRVECPRILEWSGKNIPV